MDIMSSSSSSYGNTSAKCRATFALKGFCNNNQINEFQLDLKGHALIEWWI